jgi:hypothetical protein
MILNMKLFYRYIFCIALIVLVASCSSSRKTSDAQTSVPTSQWKSGDAVLSRASIKIKDEKGKGVSLSGNLRMLRDDVIILNATYIFGIQVGFVEITKDKILIVSKVTNQYTEMLYEELSLKMGKIITFDAFQRLFWGEQSNLQINGLKWAYDSFVSLPDNRSLPSELKLNFNAGKKSIDMMMQLSNFRYDASWNPRTQIDLSTYTKLTSEQFYGLISSLVK